LDVAMLLRDSQYLVEGAQDAQINSVVSGALDRLHAEPDPCVRFDADQKLWIYLHRHRSLADFPVNPPPPGPPKRSHTKRPPPE